MELFFKIQVLNKMNVKTQNLFHTLSLLLILALGVALFYMYRGYPQSQIIISILISVLYVVWGIIHHYLKGDLHPKIVIEYSLIALLAVVLIRGAILR